MTTTISKHDLQLQQQQQQQQQMQQQQQQQQWQYFAEQQQPQLQPQQQQRSSILLKPSINTNSLMHNTVSQLDNTTKNTTTATKTTNAYDFSAAARTTTRLDSAAAIIQIDSLNNNNTSLSNITTTTTIALTAATSALPTTPVSNLVYIPAHSPSGMNNNNSAIAIATATADSHESELASAGGQPKAQRRRSLLNFKSFDFHIKSLYSGLRNSSSNKQSRSRSPSSSIGGDNANDAGSQAADTPGHRAHPINNRMPPYLKIEAVDAEESENLLLDYPQSPYSSRRNSSHDDNRSSSQLLHINRYEMSSRSQASSPSPYFLSPYATESGNIRRSSTSDIMSCKRSGTSSASDSRRPSTSDLLRRARERRGSEARMGRSVSHGGLPRGGFRSSCGGGGRRTSMAF